MFDDQGKPEYQALLPGYGAPVFPESTRAIAQFFAEYPHAVEAFTAAVKRFGGTMLQEVPLTSDTYAWMHGYRLDGYYGTSIVLLIPYFREKVPERRVAVHVREQVPSHRELDGLLLNILETAVRKSAELRRLHRS